MFSLCVDCADAGPEPKLDGPTRRGSRSLGLKYAFDEVFVEFVKRMTAVAHLRQVQYLHHYTGLLVCSDLETAILGQDCPAL